MSADLTAEAEPTFSKMDIEDSDLEEVATWQGIEAEIAAELKAEGSAEGLKMETEAFPILHPPLEAQPSEKRAKQATKIRQEAEKEAGTHVDDPTKAIAVYTEAMRVGGSTGVILVNRAALLLQVARPRAAVRDCTAALNLNNSFFKAYRVRGGAHGKLGHWKKAHRDLTEAQKLKHDATTEELQKVFAIQCKKVDPTWKEPSVEIPADKGGDPTPKAPRTLRPDIIFAPDPVIPPLVSFTPQEYLPDLDKGQAVTLQGLKAAPHLNGKRAVVERRDPRPTARGRWEVEVRLDAGKAEIKSLKRENIATLNKIDKEGCRSWAVEEKKFKEQRAKQEKMKEDFQYSKCVEAKLAKMAVGPAAVVMVRKLDPQDALNLLDRAPTEIATDDPAESLDGFIMLAAQAQLKAQEPPAKRQK